ncbi:MAG: homoserine kinase [Cohaesibacter sp.]|nr:homoserine kinase [Cohaesibacter sp.]MCV6602027.1 homoserine kinase [Cohaesibacter sp.]
MAVYTEVSDEELSEFIDGYEIGALLSYKGIAEGVENSNYLIHTEQGNFILTLYEKRVDSNDLPFFLGLKEHLAGKGLNCPVPIKNRDGKALGHLAGRPAAIISFLEGMWVRRPNVSHCEQLGVALAQMHEAGKDFELSRPNALSVSGWRPLFAMCGDRTDSVQNGLKEEIEQELAFMESHWPDDLPKGVIHADLFPDNVFFLRNEFSGLIDFYFACNDLLAYDIAICINAWCFEADDMFNVTKIRALLKGYQSIRPLQPKELQALPLLARGAALRFLLTRLYDWLNVPAGALVMPKDPGEYIKKLRFHRSIRSVADYGITD